MKHAAIVLLVWALALVQILTIQAAHPLTFPEPASWEHWGLAAAFLLTSLGLLAHRSPTAAPLPHALIVAGVLALHPFTAFGRDGSAVVLMIWLGVVLSLTSIRREWVLAFASGAVALLTAEAVLAATRPPELPIDLPDYGAVMGESHACGFLKRNLAMDVAGEGGPARFVTNSLGLRYDRDVGRERPTPTYRVLLVGDSFVAGYRTGQDETLAARLEPLLAERLSREVEVLPAGTGHPGASWQVAASCGALIRPDLLIVGLTLANDLSQSWVERRGLPSDVLDELMMPADASVGGLALLPIRVLRSIRAWRIVNRVEALVGSEVILSWYRDPPTRVHLFDPGHSLGHFYSRREIDTVRESYEAAHAYLEAIDSAAMDLAVPAVFVIFPQRFQVSDREWEATLFEYGLDPVAFDPERPNRLLTAGCRRAGLTCLDLLPAFREASPAGPLYLPRGDMHWNRQGQAVAARALAGRLTTIIGREGAARMRP